MNQRVMRVKKMIRDITVKSALQGHAWDVWSAKFNQELRNAIVCGSELEKKSFKIIFSYWQTVNAMRRLGTFEIKRRMELSLDLGILSKEALNEKL